MNYHLVTLGCQMNKSDSERLSKVIEDMGFTHSESDEDATLLGVVACSVRQKAIDKVYSKIHKWNKWKDKKNLITFVSGCLLPDDREKFLKQFDLIFQMSELSQLPAMISQYGVATPFNLQTKNGSSLPGEEYKVADNGFNTLKTDGKISISGKPVLMNKPDVKIEGFWDITPSYNSKFEAFIPIQNGCDKFCTYCAVPYTRGREISRPSEEILAETERLINAGYKSTTLLGQNVNSYGFDKKGNEISFAELLEKIGKLGDESGKDFWVYFTSPHPQDMTDDVLEAISRHKCLAKQIHLPLQSGDDHVLIKMNRNHTLNDYRKIIGSIKRIIPEATLFTDIIVGFTGESDEQFQNTAKAMEEFRFNMAYIARYSPRPGSRSARWDDDIPHEVKKKRLHELSTLLQSHSLEHNRQMTGKEYKVLVTHVDRKGKHLSGLTEGRIIVRFESDDRSLIGKFVSVKITSVADFATEGTLTKVFDNN